MAATKPHSNREWMEFFQSRLSKLNAETSRRYAKTITVIDLFLTGHRLNASGLAEARTIDDFVIELLRAGLAKTTVIRHLNIISSLLKDAVKQGWLPSADAPRDAAKRLGASDVPLPPLMREECYAECVGMLRRAMKEDGPSAEAVGTPSDEAGIASAEAGIDEAALISQLLGGMKRSEGSVEEDVLLLSLLNGAMPIEEVMMLRKSDEDRLSDVSHTIIHRNVNPRRDFIFNLRQSYKTPKQLLRDVSEKLLTRYGRFAGSDSVGRSLGRLTASSSRSASSAASGRLGDLVRDMWIAIAMKSGATHSEAMQMLDNPDAPARESWIRTVNSVLTHDMPRWYAMHLRKGVDFEELRKDIAEEIRPVPELFYPGETIRKRVGNKTVLDDKPFISNTVFFRSFPDRVQAMFSKIGDKAWCYRVTREAGSPYAVISPIDMRRFQTVIGVFTSDMEIHPLGTLVPRPGEQVMVVKAGYGNRQGEVEEVIEPTDGGSMIFRVKLSTDQGYEWRVDLDARQIQPV